MKVLQWIRENILFILTLFLLAFIPLYPKIPILDIQHTWVYVRIEDFIIAGVLLTFFIKLIRKKATIKSPLTIPIIIFWGVGAISTIIAIVFIFPHLTNVFPNLAILHYLRRIEYLSLFFVAFAATRHKNLLHPVVAVLTVTLIAVVLYGFGQRYLEFPAFLTMNEEFAKGIPLKLSDMARVPSTFAGHYDLAAYLVMLIPIMGSLIFGYRKKSLKILFFVSAILGLILLLMTASRISFGVYLLTISFMLILQQQKKFIIPVIILSLVVLNLFQGISQRFGSTISEAEVIYDARTGQAIGIATRGANNELIIEEKESTGENLPQGSGFIGIPGADKGQRIEDGIVKKVLRKTGDKATEITNLEGDFVVRKSLAYDISFTTRFQGTWPRALNAFKRNVFFGSGYSSISLASDGNYLRILGEVGLLGLSSFLLIFIALGILARKVLPDVESRTARSFIIGVLSGIFGVGLNAIMIDVFEASKVAFVMWMLIGITTGLLVLYQKKQFDMFKEVIRVLTSVPAILLYILVGSFGVYSMMTGNFFVGDDFTWLRWVADCPKVVSGEYFMCDSQRNIILSYFTDSQGFFYRPGAKLYFHLMYSIAWFSPFLYHAVSIILHFLATAFVFLIALHILRSKLFAFILAVLFMVTSGHFEAVFWISSTGHLITTVSILCSTYFFICWKEYKNTILLLISILASAIAPLFHEAGVIAPFFVLSFDLINRKDYLRKFSSWWYYCLYLLPLPIYFLLKYISQSLWSTGDYSYNFVNLLPNIIGNTIGNIAITLAGSKALSWIQLLREFSRENLIFSAIGIVAVFAILYTAYYFWFRTLKTQDKRVVILSIVWFGISALPFLGLGNIAIRYTYLPSFGILFLIVFLLQKGYQSLPQMNSNVKQGIILLLVAFFATYHTFELTRINKDWNHAGQITNNLLINMGNNFASTKTRVLPVNPAFYFVNVPITHGEAWVFPVGLSDALWFTFQNEDFTVQTFATLDEALKVGEAGNNELIFEFEKDGNISQVIQPPK